MGLNVVMSSTKQCTNKKIELSSFNFILTELTERYVLSEFVSRDKSSRVVHLGPAYDTTTYINITIPKYCHDICL